MEPISFGSSDDVKPEPATLDAKPLDETASKEAGVFAPDRQPAGFAEMEIWDFTESDKSGIVDGTLDVMEIDDDFDDLP